VRPGRRRRRAGEDVGSTSLIGDDVAHLDRHPRFESDCAGGQLPPPSVDKPITDLERSKLARNQSQRAQLRTWLMERLVRAMNICLSSSEDRDDPDAHGTRRVECPSPAWADCLASVCHASPADRPSCRN